MPFSVRRCGRAFAVLKAPDADGGVFALIGGRGPAVAARLPSGETAIAATTPRWPLNTKRFAVQMAPEIFPLEAAKSGSVNLVLTSLRLREAGCSSRIWRARRVLPSRKRLIGAGDLAVIDLRA